MNPLDKQKSPSDEAIVSLVADIRAQLPSLGVAKLVQAIKQREPTWILSEKVVHPSSTHPSVLKRSCLLEQKSSQPRHPRHPVPRQI